MEKRRLPTIYLKIRLAILLQEVGQVRLITPSSRSFARGSRNISLHKRILHNSSTGAGNLHRKHVHRYEVGHTSLLHKRNSLKNQKFSTLCSDT